MTGGSPEALLLDKTQGGVTLAEKEVRTMASSKGRTGGGIREFLQYYLLVILDEETATKERMVELILKRSSDNNHYRPGSTLLVADQEVNSAISLLLQKGCIKMTEKGDAFEIRDKGRRQGCSVLFDAGIVEDVV